jgi:sporulation protein YlmC with PRC-barrel domain
MNRLVAFALVVVLVGLPAGTVLAQQPQPSQQPPPPSGVMITSDSLIGTKVRDTQGKEIGEITKLLIDAKGGKVASAIIKQGGTLGMGGKEISVPWDALTLQRGQDQQLVVTMQQPLLEQVPPAASPGTGGQQERKP